MIKKLFLTILLLNYMSLSHGDYFDGIKCNQKKPELNNPDAVMIDHTLSFLWYKSNNPHEKIGDIESEFTSYIFWNDRFFGKVYEITGKDNINEVLRYFHREVERIYDDDPKNDVFKHPVERRDGSRVFVEPDKIIIIRRYSLNLGRVEILCRDLWVKYHGLSELMVEDLKE